MKKVCIDFETGNGRIEGHKTQFAFTGLPGVEIAALSDSNPEAENTYRRTGAARLYRDFTEMMDKERPDIVVLCSRLPEDHFRQIKFAISRGCHVLCEKPLAADLAQGDELVRLAEAAGVKIQIAHLARFAPQFRTMKSLIDAGEIGRVLNVYLRGKEDFRGGGEDMLVLGTHLLDITTFLFGAPTEIYADIRMQGRPITADDALPTNEPLGLCAGDEVFAYYRLPGNATATFESRRGMMKDSSCDRMGITVTGTKGALSLRYTKRELRIARNFPVPIEDETAFEPVPLEPAPKIPGAVPPDYEAWHADRNCAGTRYFIENNRRAAWDLLQSIEEDRAPLADARSALTALEMIIGAYYSAIRRQPAPFPIPDRKHPLHDLKK